MPNSESPNLHPLNDAEGMYPPAAYIIGAPKCGTTALAEYLADHPAISFSDPKEPHYYAEDLNGLRLCSDDEGYRACFTMKPESQLLIEASVWYLYSQSAVAAILAARPDARFIVMLRNPVKMLPSLHLQLQHALDEDQSDFETAWNMSEKRANGEAIPRSCRAPSTLDYKRTAAHGEMLERLFSQVPQERCMVIFQEDMAQDTPCTYRAALSFLGLPDDGRSDFPRINQAVKARSRAIQFLIARGRPFREFISKPIKKLTGKQSLGVMKGLGKLNDVKAGPPQIAPEVLDAVAAHYAPDVTKLGEILGKDMAAMGWRTKV